MSRALLRRTYLALASVVKGGGRRRTNQAAESITVAQPIPEAGGDDNQHVLDLLGIAPPVSVIIPVFNATNEVMACLRSVIANTGTAIEVVVINDASTDPSVAELLKGLSDFSNLRILTNDINRGFVATANRGFQETSGDVILLNSDTEVPPRWVERLRLLAYSDPTIATVTPLSNNAGAFSAPIMGADNPEAFRHGVNNVGRALARKAQSVVPSTPTANGFCMYVKRTALDDVGLFDADQFPRGYGEENDFSMKASARGWRHVVDGSTFLLHHRSASFGDERQELARQGGEVIAARHPNYPGLVREFLRSADMAQARERVRVALSELAEGALARPRVLYVLHDYGGGTPLSAADLANGVEADWEPLVLRSKAHSLIVTDLDGRTIRRVQLHEPVRFGDEFHSGYRKAVTQLLLDLDIELVHIRHLMKHPLDLPYVADALNIPTVLSFHDFYHCCPTAHLLDENDRFCEARCTPGQGSCRASPWVASGPHLKHGWVYVWRDQSESMFQHVDAFVWTTEYARDLHISVFPELGTRPSYVIEHGRDLVRSPHPLGVPPEMGLPVRVAVLGHVGIHKGADVLRKLATQAPDLLDIHVIGTLEGPATQGITVHGRYTRGDLMDKLRAIRPSYVMIPSISGETYSHTLTEAWAASIPVLVGPYGAMADRVRLAGGGWVMPVSDIDELERSIRDLVSKAAEWRRAVEEAGRVQWPTIPSMTTRYLDLYAKVLSGRRTVRSAHTTTHGV